MVDENILTQSKNHRNIGEVYAQLMCFCVNMFLNAMPFFKAVRPTETADKVTK